MFQLNLVIYFNLHSVRYVLSIMEGFFMFGYFGVKALFDSFIQTKLSSMPIGLLPWRKSNRNIRQCEKPL